MNKQAKSNGGRGIEWTDYTWNPVGGCKHECRWEMPDGSIAKCYAEDTANGVAQAAYPQGFDTHYWHPEILEDPLSLKKPSKIFLDSMSDLMGAWVPDEQIRSVLDVCARAPWHTFQLLTKNAPRLLRFEFPKNVWVGVSSPPDFMFGHRLNQRQQAGMLDRALKILCKVKARITWMSFEPLSWNVSTVLEDYWRPIDWAVIGAASNGPRYFQPDSVHVQQLLNLLDHDMIKVFFKGNLVWSPRREEFPE